MLAERDLVRKGKFDENTPVIIQNLQKTYTIDSNTLTLALTLTLTLILILIIILNLIITSRLGTRACRVAASQTETRSAP